MSILHHHPERRTHTQIHSLVLPPGLKRRQLAPQVGVLRVSLTISHLFCMATTVSLIPHSTVIWFGSLEFMSTGFGYGMILLSVRGSEGARIVPTRSKAAHQPHHHASPPKRRRDQHSHHRPTAAT